MNTFDSSIILFFNQMSNVSKSFDYIVRFVSHSQLLKGGIFMSVLCWYWFHHDAERAATREKITVNLAACFASLVIGRLMALTLPFRLRPLHNSEIPFQLPYSMDATALSSWSSFPSDHAALFFALATGLFLISRFAGILSFLYVAVFICFPRIYLGLHYPTDLLAGGLIGIGTAWFAGREHIRKKLAQPFDQWREKEPGYFYSFSFFVAYQLATLFDDVRIIGNMIFKALRDFSLV